MKKYAVVYFSNTGNNAFLAKKAANRLQADLFEANPGHKGLVGLIFKSWLHFPERLNIKPVDLADYDEIILLGPIWVGTFIAPMKALVQLCVKANKPLRYITCCGSGDEMNEEKFGYNQVLQKVKDLGGDLVLQTAAIPTALIEQTKEEKEQNKDGKIKVTDDNFIGDFRERFEIVMKVIMEDQGLLF